MATSFMTQEQTKTISTMLERKYGGNLGERFFEVETQREDKVISIKVTLQNSDKTFYYPVEARISIEDQDLTISEARDLLLDYVDAYFEEFLMNQGEVFLPIDWTTYDCDGIDLQMRGQIVNQKFEDIASALIEGKSVDLQSLTAKRLH